VTMPPRVASPRAFVISGPPASGKSSLGALLARALGAALLDQDVMTGSLVAVIAGLVGTQADDRDDPRLRAASRNAVYQVLLDAAVANLAVGTSVVLVAPFARERSDAQRWNLVSERLAAGGAPHLLWMSCPMDELVRRMRARAAPRDRAKLAGLAAYLTAEVLTPPAVAHTVIDATSSVDYQLEQALAAR